MNQLDQLIRELEGADYYHDEEETRWPLWLGWGLPFLVAWAIIIAGYVVWRRHGVVPRASARIGADGM